MDLKDTGEIIINLSETTKNQSILINNLNDKIKDLQQDLSCQESRIQSLKREIERYKYKLEN